MQVAEGQRPEVEPELAAGAPEGWCAMMEECWHQEAQQRPSFQTMYLKLHTMLEQQPRTPTVALGSDPPWNATSQDLVRRKPKKTTSFFSFTTGPTRAELEPSIMDQLSEPLL